VRRRRFGLLEAYVALLLTFIFAPLLVMAVWSFHETPALGLPYRGVSLRWYSQVLGDEQVRTAATNSLVLSLVAGLGVIVIGTLAAVAVARYRFVGRRAANVIVIAPILLPTLLYSVALLSFYAQRDVPRSLWTAAVGHIAILLPVYYLVVMTRLSRFDPALEEAARDLGANAWQSFSRVVLPLILPSMVGAFLLTVASSWDELPVALFNAGLENTIPTLIYTRIKLIVEPTINVLAVLLLVATVVLLALGRRVLVDLQR
jgi:ABC-type spermidine/putrescine transport system permease subunit II